MCGCDHGIIYIFRVIGNWTLYFILMTISIYLGVSLAVSCSFSLKPNEIIKTIINNKE